MKRKPSKQSPHFSRRNSKRNNAVFLLFFLLAFSGTAETGSNSTESPIEVDIDFALQDSDWLLNSLKEGNRSQIILQIRIYEKNDSPFPLPDKNICRITYIQTGRIDPFSGLYQISDDAGNNKFLENEKDFLTAFLHIRTEITPQCDFSHNLSNYYLQKKAILINKVYKVPFHIFQFIDYDNRISTDWIKKPF